MDERKEILEKISKGEVGVDEGLILLDKLEANNKNFVLVQKKIYTKLKIKVDIEKVNIADNMNVNLSIPISMLKMLSDFSSYIPSDEMSKLNGNGFDMVGFDFKKVIDDIENGTLENEILYSVNNDDENGKVNIKVYVE
ncbi:hypothetical protein [uncultured Clostridium sp.]|uniref:hypothetical protein n=1 Tax=uncultured Clostridium sp. TaxID=59620 RepID=UPI002625F32F|nr:hypothetical protein [uncultured Clostridium sp.]